MAYYGLFRVGEIAQGDHVIKAKDVHIGTNKDKILAVLYTSKTHGKESRPQKVSISANGKSSNKFFCPFKILRRYAKMRGEYIDENEQFFVFSDGSPVTPQQIRTVLKTLIQRLNLDPNLYEMHSFRVGMASDMLKRGIKIEKIKLAGRWKSNAVFKYIRN